MKKYQWAVLALVVNMIGFLLLLVAFQAGSSDLAGSGVRLECDFDGDSTTSPHQNGLSDSGPDTGVGVSGEK